MKPEIITDEDGRRYASYKGMMSEGVPFGCLECEEAGRKGVKMTYRGVQKFSQVEGVEAEDTLNTMGFDVWKCRYGHEHVDGY